MVDSLLVGVDDSTGARAALHWAADFMARPSEGSDPTAVMLAAWSRPAVDTQGVFSDEPFQQAAAGVLNKLASELPDGVTFELVDRLGSAQNAILAEAAERQVDLIVVGTRGRSALAQVLLGSISRSVAARADRPVAIVPDQTAEHPDGPTVVGYDDSSGARAAMTWALANSSGPITALSSWTLPSTVIYDPLDLDVQQFQQSTQDRLMAGLKDLCGGTIDPRITPLVQYRDPRTALLDPDLQPSMIVIGSRTSTGLKGLLLGSTVTYVACHSTVPVIVVPPDDDREAAFG